MLDYGITVNTINLGYVELGMGLKNITEIFQEKMKKQIPAGRFCKPEEIYNTIKYLIDTEYVNGEDLDLNGVIVKLYFKIFIIVMSAKGGKRYKELEKNHFFYQYFIENKIINKCKLLDDNEVVERINYIAEFAYFHHTGLFNDERIENILVDYGLNQINISQIFIKKILNRKL